jgi:DNA polymerase-3 subunit delta
VVLRAIDEATLETLAPLIAALPATTDTADLIVTSTGRLPKTLTDALSSAGVTRIDTKAPTGKRDLVVWATSQFVEAGLKVEAAAVSEVVAWLGQDRARLPSLVSVLLSTYGESRKLGADEVRPFLGEQGGVAPWDLTDAIDTGRMADALAMLRRMVRGGEFHPLQVVAVLHNHYTRLLRLDGAEATAPPDVMGLIGVKSDFQARKYLDASQRLGSRGVRAAIVLLADADRDLRGARDLDEELVLEILVARLARLVAPAPRAAATSRRR